MSPLSKQLLTCLSQKSVVFTVHFVIACAPLDNSMGQQCGSVMAAPKKKEKLLEKALELLPTNKPQFQHRHAGQQGWMAAVILYLQWPDL